MPRVGGMLRHVERAGAMRRGSQSFVARRVARPGALTALPLAALPGGHGGWIAGFDAIGRQSRFSSRGGVALGMVRV